MEKEKRQPASYQPPDCNLHCVSVYASDNHLTPARIYQLFQENKLEIVKVSGVQMVKTVKETINK